MSANTVNSQLFLAEAETPDPGDAKTLAVQKSISICNLVSAGAETRTLGRPTREGIILTLFARTIVGTITLTVTGGLNVNGTTTFAFSAVSQYIVLQSFRKSDGTLIWLLISDYGTGNAALAGLTSTVTELNQLHSQTSPVFVSGFAPVTVAAATTTLTLVPGTHSRRTILVQSTGGLAVTPPAATGTGDIYRFACIAAISGGSFTVDAKAGNASDVFTGWLQSYKATTFTPYPTASNSNLLTFNGTTTGGAAVGDWFEMQDIATNKWLVTGYTIQSGSIATPFSNH